VTGVDWARLLTNLDDPAVGQVAEAFADATDTSVSRAYDRVEVALEDGDLVERDRGGAFGVIDVPGEHSESDDEPAEDEELAYDSEPDSTECGNSDGDGWSDADFTAPDSGVWPPEILAREQWMGHVEKKPFAPWADRDHPEADPDEDARWKWGLTENYVDGETIALAEDDPRLDGRAFLQQPDDPFAYVDGDHVRDPETGDVHPGFEAILEHLGLTYADVSQSGAGIHAIYRGALPEGVKQASWQLDDQPWGANEDLPSVELYPGKRVCVMTGAHVPGTPTEVRPWNADVLKPLLEANDAVATSQRDAARGDVSTARDDYDLENYEPTATAATETTNDVRDVFAALDRLDARDVAERTIVAAWNDAASTSDGKRAFCPTWGPNSRGTANVVDERVWQDTGDEGGYGTPVVMALIDAGELSHRNASPRAARGELWWRGVEHLRDLGFDIPEYDPGASEDGAGEDVDPVSALPLDRLEALDRQDARRYARKRGVDWPTTEEARRDLEDRLLTSLRHREDVVIDAPTALGKSYTAATVPWLRHADVTGEQPVVHLHETTEARDQAADATHSSGGDHRLLLGRHEACPVAGGDHDPAADEEEEAPDVVVTIDGQAASEWLDAVCDGRGVPFSVAHTYLAEHNDQEVDLPCCAEEGAECYAVAQWDDVPRDEDGEPVADVIHATHGFARVPGLVAGSNVILDERPDFIASLSTDRIQRAVTAFLRTVDAPVTTWEAFVQLAQYGGYGDDASAERRATKDALELSPEREWYLQNPDAHTLAPALAKAVWYALEDEHDGNGRRSATVPHEPPRLDAGARDEDGWNRTWVTIVLDDANRVETVREAPDLSSARCVVGLDAHPTPELWQRNTKPGLTVDPLLDPQERALWRRFERGLLVVQVGDNTHPAGADGQYLKNGAAGTEVVLEHLREQYGEAFRTVITAKKAETHTAELLADVGVDDAETMHFGEEKSRNDFADEEVGLVNGCIDPGDDYVLNLLAECGLDARPETAEVDGEERREPGRAFVGPDADAAARLLASVRENHVAQAAGRYARRPGARDDTATVFVRTDATSPGFVDLEVPGVEWVSSSQQREIASTLQANGTATARELAEATGVSKRHVANTLARYVEDDAVEVREGAGDYGADVYRLLAGERLSGVADLGAEEIANSHVWSSYTWAFAIHAGSGETPPEVVGVGDSGTPAAAAQVGLGTFDGGDRPPDDPV